MAYQYRPDRVEYAIEYANILRRQDQFGKAESVLDSLLLQLRDLAAKDPAAYRPNLAKTLGTLGIVYGVTQRFGEAESAHKEALAIRRDLAAQNPAAYRPDLARTFDNLGLLYSVTRCFGEAESAFKEALATRRDLAAQKPDAYRPDLAYTRSPTPTGSVMTRRRAPTKRR
jgi:tetratricopeptide (TPR) repeat protein